VGKVYSGHDVAGVDEASHLNGALSSVLSLGSGLLLAVDAYADTLTIFEKITIQTLLFFANDRWV